VHYTVQLLQMKPLSVFKTHEFEEWLNDQPPQTKTIIKSRLDLIAVGHFGNHKRFEGLIELKWPKS
jgi:putative component of toxin-antitoxin plasmid stabilization module